MIWRDVRFAVRLYARTPGVSLVALATLALGVGANAAIFSFADALLFRPLPIRDPDRVVRLFHVSTRDAGSFSSFAHSDYVDFRDGTTVFSGLAAFASATMDVGEGDGLERVSGAVVSHNYFAVVGVTPVVGRAFTPDEDRTPGTHPVAVISQALWTRRFGASPDAIGGTLAINGRAFTIVGVAPAAFRGLEVHDPRDVWVPLMMYPTFVPWIAAPGRFEGRGNHWLDLVGRLGPGVTPASAQAALRPIVGRQMSEIAAIAPSWTWNVAVVPVHDARLGPPVVRPEVRLTRLLVVVVGLVLLIACANVANVLLARSLARRREIGVRLAVGAGRGVLVRQLLAESVLLWLAGGVAGVVLAGWSLQPLGALELPGLLAGLAPRLDARVMVFALAITLGTGVAFGLVPALQASRVDVAPALKGGEAGRRGRARREPVRWVLVAGQVALCVVLLVGTGLTLRTVGRLYALPLGFDPAGLAVATLDASPAGLPPEQGRDFHRRLVERVGALPGIEAATLSATTPFGRRRMAKDVSWEDRASGERRRTNTDLNVVGPGFFRTMRIEVVRGRAFTWDDREGAPGVTVVNAALAARLWPGDDPVGKRMWLPDQGGADRPLEVVGVVANGRYNRDWRTGSRPFMFLPSGQMYSPTLALVVRGRASAGPTLAEILREVRALDERVLVAGLQSARAAMASSIALERAGATLLSLFGLLALTLAAVGIYGVVSFAAAERTREMGVRMALGAARPEILRLMLARGLRPVVAGIVVGTAAALALARLIASLLFGVEPTDPATFAAVAGVLMLVALVAGYVPARRATRVDPVTALRAE